MCNCFSNKMWFTACLKEKSDCFRQWDVVHNHQKKTVIVSDSEVLFTAWPTEECVIVLATRCGSRLGWEKKSLIISDNEMWFITTKRRVWLFQTTGCTLQPRWKKSDYFRQKGAVKGQALGRVWLFEITRYSLQPGWKRIWLFQTTRYSLQPCWKRIWLFQTARYSLQPGWKRIWLFQTRYSLQPGWKRIWLLQTTRYSLQPLWKKSEYFRQGAVYNQAERRIWLF